jgi:hypothetical protein
LYKQVPFMSTLIKEIHAWHALSGEATSGSGGQGFL